MREEMTAEQQARDMLERIALDEYSAGCYPHIEATATNGQCIFKIDAEEWKP